jgi:hypothetical protein
LDSTDRRLRLVEACSFELPFLYQHKENELGNLVKVSFFLTGTRKLVTLIFFLYPTFFSEADSRKDEIF